MRRSFLAITLLALGCASDFSPDLSDLGSSAGDDGGTADDGGTTDGDTSHGSDNPTGPGDDGGSSSDDDGGSSSDDESSSSSDDGGSSNDDGSSNSSDPNTTSETSETSSGFEEPGPGDPCHPLSHEMADVPSCSDPFTCFFQGWDLDEEHWAWACEMSEAQGEWLDPCVYEANTCAVGFKCHFNVFIDGDCDSYCCTPYCDPLNPACPPGYECMALGDETSMFPPFFKDTDIPFVGYCGTI